MLGARPQVVPPGAGTVREHVCSTSGSRGFSFPITLVPGGKAEGRLGQAVCSTATSRLLPSVSSRRIMRLLWCSNGVLSTESRAEEHGRDTSLADTTWGTQSKQSGSTSNGKAEQWLGFNLELPLESRSIETQKIVVSHCLAPLRLLSAIAKDAVRGCQTSDVWFPLPAF